MAGFTEEQKKKARKADLYVFLIRNHPDEFSIEGDSLRFKRNHSISIKEGYSGYSDFATDETGNSIDFVVNYMGYSVNDAVLALNDVPVTTERIELRGSPEIITSPKVKVPKTKEKPVFPEPLNGPFRNLFAYLMSRGISKETIQFLIDKKLIYQESVHNNIVFVNEFQEWGEVHGTYTEGGKSFHGIVENSVKNGNWCFKTCDNPADVKVAYICEAAIDAISLYELHRIQKLPHKYENAAYVSIGGAGKQGAIDILKGRKKLIIAVDNDRAGSECRIRNVELQSEIPVLKDWNDDLMAYINRPLTELEKVIKEGVEAGIIPEGWEDPYNNADHARYMIEQFAHSQGKGGV